MGKSDQRKTQNEISRSTDSMYKQEQGGINDTQNRINTLQPRADNERANLLSGYGQMARTGGIDPAYEGSINNNLSRMGLDADALRRFASTGGINEDDLAHIYDPTLTEFSKTGGYSDKDIGDIRARSNSSIASTYGNLKNDMAMRNLNSGGIGPGWDSANASLARRGAQDVGTNARNTEVDIRNAVRSGRMSAADILSQRGMGVAGLRSSNTLQGYRGASDIDASRSGIGMDMARMRQSGQQAGMAGLSNTYGTAPAELMANQNLLRGYRGDLMQGQNAMINNRTEASRIPGIGSTIGKGVGIAAQIAGMAAGGIPGLMASGILSKLGKGNGNIGQPGQNGYDWERYGIG